MPIRVNLPSGAVANFPDGTPPEEIERELSNFSQPSRPATPPPPGATIGMLAQSTAKGDPKPPRSVFGRELRPDIAASMDQAEADGTVMDQSPFLGNPLALVGAAKQVPGILAKGLGISKARAGSNIAAAVDAAKAVPVATEKAGEAGLGMMEYQGIETVPRVVQSFMRRVTDPKQGELAVEEARRYYSAMSRMSVNEFNRLTPQMQRQVGAMRAALDEAIRGAADTVGKGKQYASGMKEYARASKVRKAASKTAKYAAGATGFGALYHGLTGD